MLPDRVSNPGPLTYESGALPITLRGLAAFQGMHLREVYIPEKCASFFSKDASVDINLPGQTKRGLYTR